MNDTTASPSPTVAHRDRLARLQTVTAALSGSLTLAQVAQVVVAQGVEALEAYAGVVVLLSADGTMLELLRSEGYSDEALRDWKRFPLDASSPISDAVRKREPIFLSTLSDWRTRYPITLGEVDTDDFRTDSWAAIPLIVQERSLGVMGLTFSGARNFTDEDKDFMLVLAQQCAQAMERAQLYEDAEAAQHRMAFLAEASAVLGSSLDYKTTLTSITALAVPQMCDWCMVDMLSEDGKSIERLSMAHTDPKKFAMGQELYRKYPTDLQEPSGLARVLRTGEARFVPKITDAMLERTAKSSEELAGLLVILPRSYICVPLIARGRILGAITLLGTQDSGRVYTESDLRLAQELASRAALAVDNARLYQDAQRERTETANILESITDAFLALDREWRYTYVNKLTEAYLHRDRSDLIGKVIWEEYPQGLGAAFEEQYRRAMRDRVAVDVEAQSEVSGRWLSVRAYPSDTGLSIYFRDVTEQHEAEEERQRAALMQRAFVKDVLTGVTEGRLRLCDTPEELPAPLPSLGVTPIPLTKNMLKPLRTALKAATEQLSFSHERYQEIVTAVDEAAMNAVVHGHGGIAEIYGNSDVLQIRIRDNGTGISMVHLPRATLEPGYTTGESLGHGFWLMLKTADRVWLLTGPSGTTVVIEQDRIAAIEPAWLSARRDPSESPALPV